MDQGKASGREERTIFHLADAMKSMGGADAHMTIQGIRGEKGLTAVISVYDNVKPAQMILEELYEWAEQTERQDVVDMIQKLEEDMSWDES